MEVDILTVQKLASLAKLEFSPAEQEDMKEELTKILTFINQLDELDTHTVSPLIHLTHSYDLLREDEIKQTINQADALKNAPHKDTFYFHTPKVIE